MCMYTPIKTTLVDSEIGRTTSQQFVVREKERENT